jgi:hypothetical protein
MLTPACVTLCMITLMFTNIISTHKRKPLILLRGFY